MQMHKNKPPIQWNRWGIKDQCIYGYSHGNEKAKTDAGWERLLIILIEKDAVRERAVGKMTLSQKDVLVVHEVEIIDKAKKIFTLF